MSIDVFGELRSRVRAAALDHAADPGDRVARLEALRAPLVQVLGELDQYRGDARLVREAAAGEDADRERWARANASLRDDLIEAGELTGDEADAMGMLSHDEIDKLAEEGLLQEALTSIARRWEEALHPRSHGKFADKPGGHEPAPAREPHLPAAPARPGRGSGRAAAQVDHEAEARMHAEHDERTLRSLSEYVATKAEAAERTVTPLLQDAVSGEGGRMEGLDHRLKSRASVQSKLRRKRDTMPLATDEERAASIGDALRYTAVFDDQHYNQGVERTLGALQQRGFKVGEAENYWHGDDDYDGLHVGVTAPNGATVELQFHTHDSLATKTQKNHALYEQFRESKDPHQRWELWQQMVAHTQAIPKPKGVEELGTLVSKPQSKRPAEPTTAKVGGGTFTQAHHDAAQVLERRGSPGTKGDAARIESEAAALHAHLSSGKTTRTDEEDLQTLSRVLPAQASE